jgi:hypothetical protein
MTRICTDLRIKAIFLLLPLLSKAQSGLDTLGFYNHLVNHNLLYEQLAFNQMWLLMHPHNKQVSDSIHLNNSIVYFKLGIVDSVHSNLRNISPAPLFTSFSTGRYISLLMLNSKVATVDSLLATDHVNSIRHTVFINDTRLASAMYRRQDISKDSALVFSEQMQDIKTHYLNMPHHSMLVAGIASTLIPGLGKLYLGYKYQALSAFIINTLLAAQSIESYERAGPKSFRFIASTSLFGLFYGGNILGTLISAHKQKHDHYKQTEHEIFDYYSDAIGTPVH